MVEKTSTARAMVRTAARKLHLKTSSITGSVTSKLASCSTSHSTHQAREAPIEATPLSLKAAPPASRAHSRILDKRTNFII